MSVPTLLLAATLAVAAPNGDVTGLTCNLAMPDGSHFQMSGHFDDDGLHSNLSGLIQVQGAFASVTSEKIVITTDGTVTHGWSKAGDGKKFDVVLTQYGSGPAVLTVEKRTFVGRHWGRGLIGVGFCNVRRAQSGGKPS